MVDKKNLTLSGKVSSLDVSYEVLSNWSMFLLIASSVSSSIFSSETTSSIFPEYAVIVDSMYSLILSSNTSNFG